MGKLLSETTIKLDTELLRLATGVAQAEGITRSEYIRDLITVDIQLRRRKHAAMNSVFGQLDPEHHELSGVTGLDNESDHE
jgi:metal-responsive CopG/Arc/MetJ family transcriptional regulator